MAWMYEAGEWKLAHSSLTELVRQAALDAIASGRSKVSIARGVYHHRFESLRVETLNRFLAGRDATVGTLERMIESLGLCVVLKPQTADDANQQPGQWPRTRQTQT